MRSAPAEKEMAQTSESRRAAKAIQKAFTAEREAEKKQELRRSIAAMLGVKPEEIREESLQAMIKSGLSSAVDSPKAAAVEVQEIDQPRAINFDL
jgi:hypothetical protein